MPKHEWLAQDPVEGRVENERHAEHSGKDGQDNQRPQKVRTESNIRR